MKQTTITLHNVKLDIHYTVDGKYYPETRETPAEYPEATIHKITAEDSDIDIEALLENYVEEIYEILNKEL